MEKWWSLFSILFHSYLKCHLAYTPGESLRLTYDTSREELQSHSTDTLMAAKPTLQRIVQLLVAKNAKIEVLPLG
jgi:hypothetical protein